MSPWVGFICMVFRYSFSASSRRPASWRRSAALKRSTKLADGGMAAACARRCLRFINRMLSHAEGPPAYPHNMSTPHLTISQGAWGRLKAAQMPGRAYVKPGLEFLALGRGLG